MKKLSRKFLILILGLTLALPGLAQTYNSRHITTRDGLASGFIRQIYQDSVGFIWVATNNGLSKYDGYNFTNYRNDPNDSASVSGSYIWEIQPAGPNHFFVATSGGVNLFNIANEVFEKISLPEDIPSFTEGTFDIDVNNKGDAWVAARRGLYFIPGPNLVDQVVEFYPYYQDTANLSFNPALAVDQNRGVIWLDFDKKLHQFNLEQKEFTTFDQLPDPVNRIIDSEIWQLHIANDGTLLVPALGGLLEWKLGEDEPSIVDSFDDYILENKNEPAFQAIWEDKQGNIYLGTGRSGAFIWDRDDDRVTNFKFIPEVSGVITSNDVHYFFRDRENNYWFGHHNRGLSLLYSNQWDYTYEKLFPEKPVNDPLNFLNDVITLGNGARLLSSDGGLILQSAEGSKKVFTMGEDSTARYLDLTKAGEKVLVTVSYVSNGFLSKPFLFDPRSGEFKALDLPDSINIVDFKLDLPNQVTYGSFGPYLKRLVSINKTDFSWEVLPIGELEGNNLTDQPKISAVGADSKGNKITISLEFRDGETYYEFYLFDQEKKTFEKLDVSNSENLVRFDRPTISNVYEGVVYTNVGTGIMRKQVFEDQTDFLFQENAGVISEGGTYILEDHAGNLWMNNLSGLMRLDPVSESVTFFEWSGSKRIGEFSRGQLSDDGEVLWLGDGGLVRFNPDSLEKFDPISRVFISEIRSTEQVYSTLYEQEELVFSSSQSNLSFSCLALNYQDPLATQYRYRIVGYDEEWLDIGAQRRVYLANMPPGKYEFQLQAAGKNGGFSEAMGSARFEILPPWWRTWWAYTGYGLLLILGVSGLHLFQKSRTIRKERDKARDKELAQAREIEKAYNELKTTQQQLIHSEKMASLGELTAGIAHEIQNPLNFVNNFSDVNSELLDELKEALKKSDLKEVAEIADDISDNEKKIVHHGKRAEEIVKSMLQHSRGTEGKKEPTDLNTIADEYLRLAFHGMRAKDKSFNSEMETDFDENLGLVSVVPQDIGRVILNLITNAFHALHQRKQMEQEGYQPKVTVRTLRNDGNVELRVKDNGTGIPEAIRRKVFEPFFSTKSTGEGTGLGLSLSYDIITKGHNGQIRVESQEGEGTEFILILPDD